MDDQVLGSAIERLAADNRDVTAWSDLYTSLYPFLYASMFRMMRANRFLAEESVQEAMMRLLRNFDFRSPGVSVASLMSYMKQTIRSVAFDVLDKERRMERHEEIDSLDPAEFSTEAGSPETSAILADLYQKLRGELSSHESEVLDLLAGGASVDRVAEVLSVSKKRAYNLTGNVRRKVRSILFAGAGKMS